MRNFIYIGDNVKIGANTKIANFCNIDSEAQIGSNCNFQAHCYIPSNTVIEDDVFLAGYSSIVDEKYPAVGRQIRKTVRIGKGAILGIKSTVVACNIGAGAVLGANSVAFKDIPDGQVWVGNPAKPLTITREDYNKKKEYWENELIGTRSS